MHIPFEHDEDFKALVRLAAEHDLRTLACMRNNWRIIGDAYDKALRNLAITDGHWYAVRAYRDDAQKRADFCDEAYTAAY